MNKIEKAESEELKFKKGDEVKIRFQKTKLTIDYSEMCEGKRYWFVKERVCAILEDNLVKIK